MSDTIDDVHALEACIGKTPGPMHLKVIDHLDHGALHWIASSSLCFVAFGDGAGIAITLGGDEPGFVRATDPKRLILPVASLDDAHLAKVGQGFGALFLTPAVGETLRVNGRVLAVSEVEIEIAVEECYVHCAKALIRSNFWSALPHSEISNDPAQFLAQSRLMALATIDQQGRADLSPKGDPAGTMLRLHEGAVCYADRPGNRRADSFRNILVQPRIAAAALIPGSTQIAVMSGVARITTDSAMRAGFAVDGKTPLLATYIEKPQLVIRESAALQRARLWPVTARAEGIDPAAMLVAHVKANKTNGIQATLVRTVLLVPGLMEKGLKQDYKTNLY
ncbi:MAG: pyridoxamine 5'-phosphate oxidase family protein [Pseudomonadota bacterium]